ncbi:NYN domain-containing protein [Caulobacter sp. LARHSG274]
MSRVAIFVDAGYLFAQGSVALAGEKKRRTELRLNETAALAELVSLAREKTDNGRLLRTYWYDAPPANGMSGQHTALAATDYVKLRLGVLNGQGQQKGVDSLIVTDLIELARNKSICDAVLLSGDEDVRIGVQIAQNFGVGIHLIGIKPARGSQSRLLRYEADTTTEWDATVISKFLTVAAPLSKVAGSPASATGSSQGPVEAPLIVAVASANGDDVFKRVADDEIAAMDTSDVATLTTFWDSGQQGLPAEVDRPFLGKCRDAVARQLTSDERRAARIYFASAVKAIAAKAP